MTESGVISRRPSQEVLDGGAELGTLPQWRLDDLYSGMDSAAFVADWLRAAEEARAFAGA